MAGNRRINTYFGIGVAAAIPIALVVGMFVVLPAAHILFDAFSWHTMRDTIVEGRVRHVLWITLWQSSLSTALATLIGVPLAAVLAHHTFPGQRVVATLISMPFVLPTVVVALAAVGISGGHHPLVAIVVTHAYFNTSVVVRIVRSHLRHNTTVFQHAAENLGAGPITKLFTIDIPLARRSIVQSATLVFVFCTTSFGVVRILGGISSASTEAEIFIRAIQLGDMRTAAALSLIQTVFLAFAVLAFRPSGMPFLSRPISIAANRRLPRWGILSMWVIASMFFIPVLFVASKSVRTGGHWTLAGWHGIDTAVMLNSARFCIAAAIVATALGGVAVLGIAYAGRIGRVVNLLASLPIVISSIILSIGIVATFNRGWYDFRGAQWLLPVMHAVVALPVCFRILRGPVERLTTEHRDATSTLGASPFMTLATLDLAAMRKVWAQTFAIAACISLGEFGAASVLTRNGTRTIPLEMSRLLGRPGDINQLQAYALATILMTAVAGTILVLGERDA